MSRRALFAWLWTVACVECASHAATHASSHASHASPPHNHQHNSTLVNELRRQLMENNYDYMPSESEEPLVTRPSLFNKKAVEDVLVSSSPPPAAAAAAAAPLGRSDTHFDKTHLEFDLEFNNPNKEYDINNNINTENDEKFMRRLEDDKKEYKNLDRDYTDLKRKHDEIVQQFNKKKVDREYATLKKEHEKVNAAHDRDPPNRDYDDDQTSNQMHLEDTQDARTSESDINRSYERHKTKRKKIHKLNEKMEETLKEHHNENDVKRSEFMKHNNNVIREVDVGKELGYIRAAGAGADDEWADVNSEGTPLKQIEMEKQMGLIPRAHDDTDSESSGMSKKHGVHKNDLLYYMNDDRLKQAEDNYLDLSNAGEGEGESNGSGISSSSDDYNDKTTTTVKYNVFTVVAEGGGGRRAGGAGGRRAFVREQRPGEVVVLRLDDQPFPQFRLPAARRQYMHSAENKH